MHLYWRDFHKGLQAGESIFRSFASPRYKGHCPLTLLRTLAHIAKISFFHRRAILEIELTTSTSTSTQSSDSPIASASTNLTFFTTSTPDLNLTLDDNNP